MPAKNHTVMTIRVPMSLYERLRSQSERDHRSMTQQVVAILDHALPHPRHVTPKPAVDTWGENYGDDEA